VFDEPIARAYVSLGVWVARCPRPWCVHADHYGPGPNTGRVGGLTTTTFHCMWCGLTCAAEWPANAEDLWAVLMQRPMPETRNWELGETLELLLAENVMHGLLPPGIEKGIDIFDGRFADRQLIAAGPRLMIGG
jgi:hypothetical protein